jgi:hypothetical protein
MEPMSKVVGRHAVVTATVVCLVLGVASVLRVVGSSNLFPAGGEKTLRPIAFDDFALQFYYGQLGGRFLTEGGVTYGYDPNFMAGYPKTPVYYPSSKPYELALGLFSSLDPGTVFNFSVFAMLAAVPFLVYGAAANFRLSRGERLAVVAMSIVPHLMVPVAGFYGIMEAAGMVPFIFASFLSVYVVSLVHRFLSTGERRAGAALLVTAPLLYLSHLTAVFISARRAATRGCGWCSLPWPRRTGPGSRATSSFLMMRRPPRSTHRRDVSTSFQRAGCSHRFECMSLPRCC